MRTRLWSGLGTVVVASVVALTGVARAEAPPAAVAPYEPAAAGDAAEPPAAPAPPPATLEAADAAVDAGNLALARELYERVARESPETAEGAQARRALKILARARAAFSKPVVDPPDTRGVVLRREPYSTKTNERLRLTAWEKLDFGTTAFLYGMSVGYSYALGLQDPADGLPVIAIGALGYTLGAVAFLNLANPDRGDLPLALGITSYVPTTTLLVANVLTSASTHDIAVATTVAGVLAVPLAIYAAHELDLDPGDAQLVRDAGFWGLVLGTTGALAYGGSNGEFGFHQDPSVRTVSSAGLLGLYGGLGLGALVAHFNDISLERVRVSTWGGYGGAVVGLLLAAGARASDVGAYRALNAGALLGLLVTFAATSSLDGIPPDDQDGEHPDKEGDKHASRLRVTPTAGPMLGVDGQTRTLLGASGSFF